MSSRGIWKVDLPAGRGKGKVLGNLEEGQVKKDRWKDREARVSSMQPRALVLSSPVVLHISHFKV